MATDNQRLYAVSEISTSALNLRWCERTSPSISYTAGIRFAWFTVILCLCSLGSMCVCCADTPDVLSQVIATMESNRMALKSLRADAVYRRWNGNGQLTRHALISLESVGENYRMDVRYQKVEQPSGFPYDRVVIISDGESLFVNSFSKRFRPGGCEIRIMENNSGTFALASGGLQFDPSSPSELMLSDLPAIENRVRLSEETAKGHSLLEYDLNDNCKVVFEVSPEVAFNVLSFEGTCDSAAGTSTKYTAEWDRLSGIWYVRRLLCVSQVDDKEDSRIELEYTSFDPNLSILPERFSLDALEPCETVRLIDDRPEAEVRVQQYAPRAVEKQLDNIAEEVRELPARVSLPPEATAVDAPRRSVVFWLLLFNSVLLVVIAAYIVYRNSGKRRVGH